MKNLVLRWAISTVALMALPVVFGSSIEVDDWKTAILAAAVVGVVNTIIKPVMQLLSLPITLLTLGLFNLVINAVCLLIVAKVVPGFTIEGFWIAVLAAIVFSAVTWAAKVLLTDDED